MYCGLVFHEPTRRWGPTRSPYQDGQPGKQTTVPSIFHQHHHTILSSVYPALILSFNKEIYLRMSYPSLFPLSVLQPPGGGPGTHLMLQNMDHTRPQGHPNLGPMQRMSGPRGMGPMGPGPQVDHTTDMPQFYYFSQTSTVTHPSMSSQYFSAVCLQSFRLAHSFLKLLVQHHPSSRSPWIPSC